MKRYGLIGYPVTHSFSKQYFTDKFAGLGLSDHVYEPFSLPAITELPALLAAYPDLKGFNVTIPHKVTIQRYLDEITSEATALGAVNTVTVAMRNGKPFLRGYNTDYPGFLESLQPLLTPLHKKALVLGTGGAHLTVCHVLKQLGIAVTVVSRQQTAEAIAYAAVSPQVMNDHKLIINTTPLGMYPDIDSKPALPYAAISPEHLLYDLVYNPAETAFLQEGKKRGAATKNGLEMLYIQAEHAWEIWNTAQ